MEQLEDLFTQWYSLVDPKFQPEQRSARLAAVSELSKSLETGNVISLIRQFYRFQVDQSYVETLRAALKKDEKYIPSDEEAELAVISGSVIYSTLSKPSNNADALALGVFCAEAVGLRKCERIDRVVTRCRDYLREEAIRVREEQTPAPKFSVDAFAKTIGGLASHHGAGLPAYGPALDKFLLDLNKALGKYSADLTKHIGQMESHRKEESDILYWLLGERTRDGAKYSEMDVARTAILAAVDLAKMTVFLPGLASGTAFMQRMLQRSRGNDTAKVSIPDCVASLNPEERHSIAIESPPRDPKLMPVLFAVAKSEESGGEGWTSAFTVQTELDPKKKIEPLKIAGQLYCELLFLRAVS